MGRMENKIIKLRKDVTSDMMANRIWAVLEIDWHSVSNKQILVDEIIECLLPVIEDKK